MRLWKIIAATWISTPPSPRVSYTANGIHFQREIFASAADQVIVDAADGGQAGADFLHRRHADAAARPVCRLEDGDTLVMSGVNGAARGIPGALKFQARVRVLRRQEKPPSSGG